MPRVLTCIDAVPAVDGSCAQQAWLEQPSWVDQLPTVEEANDIGMLFFFSLVAIAAAKRLFKPPKE